MFFIKIKGLFSRLYSEILPIVLSSDKEQMLQTENNDSGIKIFLYSEFEELLVDDFRI